MKASPALPLAPSSVWVGCLAPTTVEEDLLRHFSRLAPVESVKLCRDFGTRRVLGHGYVNFRPEITYHAGQVAVERLNNSVLNGKAIRVQPVIRDPNERCERQREANIFIRQACD
ncbi:hypothetical protein WJX73_002018 [Symbiochloris irregularis]|uniref:RRM domain-containing protein n=1 Tax=Symbiochloris irregularis TaxID=706552 RepID=A0AAW1PZ36_9CHLO